MKQSSRLWNFPLRAPCQCAQRVLEHSESHEFARPVKAGLVSCVWDVCGMPSGHGPLWWIGWQAEERLLVFIGFSLCARHNYTCFLGAEAFSLQGRTMAMALSSALSDSDRSQCRLNTSTTLWWKQLGPKTHSSKSQAYSPILPLQTPHPFGVAPAHLSLPISFYFPTTKFDY